MVWHVHPLVAVVRVTEHAIEFDGPPEGLTPEVLTTIYGEEDWEATIESVDDDSDIMVTK